MISNVSGFCEISFVGNWKQTAYERISHSISFNIIYIMRIVLYVAEGFWRLLFTR